MNFANKISSSNNTVFLSTVTHQSPLSAKRQHIIDVLLFLSFLILSFLPFNSRAHEVADNSIATLEETQKAINSVIQLTQNAVVHIFTEKNTANARTFFQAEQAELLNEPFFDDFFGSDSDLKKNQTIIHSHGSGFLIDKKGYILTNSHVIQDAEKIVIQLLDRRQFNANIIGMDSPSDIALIKIEGNDLPTMPLGDSDSIETGDWAIAIGYPYLRRQTVTMGIICATNLNDIGINEYENYIQTDAIINHGNSGGPLVNIHGQAIGMNTTFSSPVKGAIGAGFAIPINMVAIVAQQLKNDGLFIKGWLGATIRRSIPGRNNNSQIKIIAIQPDSPADRSGLKKGE